MSKTHGTTSKSALVFRTKLPSSYASNGAKKSFGFISMCHTYLSACVLTKRYELGDWEKSSTCPCIFRLLFDPKVQVGLAL
jgi:hypothetical protein